MTHVSRRSLRTASAAVAAGSTPLDAARGAEDIAGFDLQIPQYSM